MVSLARIFTDKAQVLFYRWRCSCCSRNITLSLSSTLLNAWNSQQQGQLSWFHGGWKPIFFCSRWRNVKKEKNKHILNPRSLSSNLHMPWCSSGQLLDLSNSYRAFQPQLEVSWITNKATLCVCRLVHSGWFDKVGVKLTRQTVPKAPHILEVLSL